MNLKYLVIKCNDLEKSKAFYEAIGFHPVKEKHGSGVEHYSFKEFIQRLKFISYDQELSKNKDGIFSINDPDGNKIHIIGMR